jgi:hypothetical protein
MIASWNPFLFLKHRFHILHFPNLTGFFTKPTGHHYTKYRFCPDIASENWVGFLSPKSRVQGKGRQLCEIAVSEYGSAQLTGWLNTTYGIWSPELCLRPHFTHETESPWPLHFRHSHWWKRRSRSKFTSHYAWGTNGVCECKMDVEVYLDSYVASNGSCFHGHLDYFQKPLLGGMPNTNLGDHGTLNVHNHSFVLFLSCVRTLH